MENHTEEDRILQLLKDYRSGKLDKYEAMDALELDNVGDLLALLAQYGVGPELSPAYYQSDPSAKPLKDFFAEGG
jgi:hypothetical protein